MITYSTIAYVSNTPAYVLDDLSNLSPSATGDGAVLLDIEAAIDMVREDTGIVSNGTRWFLEDTMKNLKKSCGSVFFTN